MTSNRSHSIAFISDIHSNLEALNAVLQDIEDQNVASIYCLGDIIGYGPDPLPCTSKIKELTEQNKILATVCGNHDKGACDGSYQTYSSAARETLTSAIDLMQGTEEFAFLEKLCKESLLKKIGRFWLVHSTINPPPEHWEYLKIKNAPQNFVERKIVFLGHSHVPSLYAKYTNFDGWSPIELFSDDGYYMRPSSIGELLSPGEAITQYRLQIPDSFPTMIINVGSVGQPRDDNPNARYVLYTSKDNKEFLEYREVGYDIKKTVAKHKERGLPSDKRLATRLCTGGNTAFDSFSPQPDWFDFD